jgi:hypothetical protein
MTARVVEAGELDSERAVLVGVDQLELRDAKPGSQLRSARAIDE